MHVALVGGGVIGGGWAGRLVENGIDVIIYDPHPQAERRVQDVLENAERAWGRLTLAPRSRGTVSFASSIREAVRDAEVIQESAPEDEALKRRLLSEIDAHAQPDALVCSSTSGLLPTRLQADMAHPERFVVGHPFNPVYLLPLVEVVAGERTSENTVERAMSFYASLAMKPLYVRKEIDGFVADRLLEALWREALWLVHDDVATVEEVDDAILYGAGLRWAQMGTFLTYRMAGGEEGMRHFLAQFGPALEWPWTKLTDVPELTDELIDKIAAQSDAQAAGRSVRELERLRDDNLVALLQALRVRDYAAGAVLREHETRLFAAAAPGVASPDPTQPLSLHEAVVDPSWVDYNGHMTEARYLHVFAESTDAFLRHVGIDVGIPRARPQCVHRRVASASFARGRGTGAASGYDAGSRRGRQAPASLPRDEPRADWRRSRHRRAPPPARRHDRRPCLSLDRTLCAGRVAAAAAAHAELPVPEGVGRAVTMRRG